MSAFPGDEAPSSETPKPKYWPALSVEEQAFVVAYIENAYSVKGAAEATGLPQAHCQRMINRADVRRAVYEVQSDLDGIDFLNERWVKAQVMRLLPMVMGEEDVPMINNLGDSFEARKFFPEATLGLLKMVNDMAKVAGPGDDETPTATSVEIVVEDASRADSSQGE